MWQWDNKRLSAAKCLKDSERRALHRVVRHWCVRYAAYRASRLLELQLVLLALMCAVCLIGPAAAVGVAAGSSLSTAGLALAGATYLAVFGAVSAVYIFALDGPSWLRMLGWLGSALGVITALGVTLVWKSDPWPAIGLGLAAGGIAVLVIVAVHMALLWSGRLFWFPIRHRVLGAISPSWIVAARLWYVLDALEQAACSWRQPATRRRLLGWVAPRYWLEEAMPRAIWFAGCRGSAHTEATRRLQHAAAFVNSLAWRIADCNDQAEYDRIRRDLAEATVAVASGNWAPILAHELPRPSTKRRFVHRLVPAGSLTAAALILPVVPAFGLTDTQQTTVQAALLVGAVLTLTSADQGARDQILDAFSDPHRRS